MSDKKSDVVNEDADGYSTDQEELKKTIYKMEINQELLNHELDKISSSDRVTNKSINQGIYFYQLLGMKITSHKQKSQNAQQSIPIVGDNCDNPIIWLAVYRQVMVFLMSLCTFDSKQPGSLLKYQLKFSFQTNQGMFHYDSIHCRAHIFVIQYMSYVLRILHFYGIEFNGLKQKEANSIMEECKKANVLCRHYFDHLRHVWWEERASQTSTLMELDDNFMDGCFELMKAKITEFIIFKPIPDYISKVMSNIRLNAFHPSRLPRLKRDMFHRQLIGCLRHYQAFKMFFDKTLEKNNSQNVFPPTLPTDLSETLITTSGQIPKKIIEFWKFEQLFKKRHHRNRNRTKSKSKAEPDFIEPIAHSPSHPQPHSQQHSEVKIQKVPSDPIATTIASTTPDDGGKVKLSAEEKKVEPKVSSFWDENENREIFKFCKLSYIHSVVLQAILYSEIGKHYKRLFSKKLDEKYLAKSMVCFRRAILFAMLLWKSEKMNINKMESLLTMLSFQKWFQHLLTLAIEQQTKNEEFYKLKIESVEDFLFDDLVPPGFKILKETDKTISGDETDETDEGKIEKEKEKENEKGEDLDDKLDEIDDLEYEAQNVEQRLIFTISGFQGVAKGAGNVITTTFPSGQREDAVIMTREMMCGGHPR